MPGIMNDGTCCKPETETQIQEEVSRLDVIMEEVRATTRTLVERLGSVLRSNDPTPEDELVKQEQELVPLASSIRHCRNISEDTMRMLRSVLERMEL